MKLRTHVERIKMFIWFNKDNNPKSHFRTSENATWVEKPKCLHLGDPWRVLFNTRTLWPRNGASLYFSSWALQHAVHISIIAVKIVSLGFASSSNISVQTRGSLEQKQKYQSGQYKMQTADWEVYNLFSNSHYDKRTSFLITQLPKN